MLKYNIEITNRRHFQVLKDQDKHKYLQSLEDNRDIYLHLGLKFIQNLQKVYLNIIIENREIMRIIVHLYFNNQEIHKIIVIRVNYQDYLVNYLFLEKRINKIYFYVKFFKYYLKFLIISLFIIRTINDII